MANFEGNVTLNVETSEIEINGKFKLTGEELDTVAGGANDNKPKCVTNPEEIDFIMANAGTNLIAGVELR